MHAEAKPQLIRLFPNLASGGMADAPSETEPEPDLEITNVDDYADGQISDREEGAEVARFLELVAAYPIPRAQPPAGIPLAMVAVPVSVAFPMADAPLPA